MRDKQQAEAKELDTNSRMLEPSSYKVVAVVRRGCDHVVVVSRITMHVRMCQD